MVIQRSFATEYDLPKYIDLINDNGHNRIANS